MRTILYPAIFSVDERNGYTVTFPDLLGCVTEGNSLMEAVDMAEDALGLYLYSLKEDGAFFPEPSDPFSIVCEDKEFINLIKWDEEEYLKRTDNKAVKKTLTIPAWLNRKAEEKELNFSEVLRRALKKELGLSES